MDTLQSVLKDLYCAFGGDRANVNALEDIDAILSEIVKLDIGAKINAAVELPELPDDDGAYVLTATIDEGAATYSWEAAPEAGT